jgi:hypothetical protein
VDSSRHAADYQSRVIVSQCSASAMPQSVNSIGKASDKGRGGSEMSASDAHSSNESAPAAANAMASESAPANAPAPTSASAPANADALVPAPANACSPVDAPAPIEALPPGAADEVISQAAGEQIDELLAKADVERIAGEIQNAATPAASTDPGSTFAGANEPNAEIQVQSPSSPVTEQQAGLDEFSATNIEGKSAPDEAPAKVKPQATAPGVGESSSAQDAPSQPTSTEADAVGPNEDDAAKEQGKIPAWLIPLELLNRPFEMLPDSIRSALGKAAILTLINATALLIYVFKFRK